MMQAEFGTKDLDSLNIYGRPFSNYGTPTETLFTKGTDSLDGVRFKDENNNWVYCTLGAAPFNNNTYLFDMLTNWKSPWEIMEQHLVASYAHRNNIPENTWFVYNDNEYKYKNVGTVREAHNNNLTCVIFKKFKSKIGAGITYNGNDLEGHDIEYVIHSGLYRGYVSES